MRLRRIALWVGVALTVALVALGIWYYVRDDYPFQLTSTEITGLAIRTSVGGHVVSGIVAHPPAELATWVSSMEKETLDTSQPATMQVTILRSDGPALRLSIAAGHAAASWVDADGHATPPVGLQLNQAFLWYLRGVRDGLATGAGRVRPLAPGASSPSPVASGSPQSSDTRDRRPEVAARLSIRPAANAPWQTVTTLFLVLSTR